MQTILSFAAEMPTVEVQTNLVAELSLKYSLKLKPSQLPRIDNSASAVAVLRRGWNKDTINLFEEFKALFVNRNNRVIGSFRVSIGTTSATLCDPKLLFGAAVKASASGIVLAHNHPSGNLTPSDADITLTKRMKSAGTLLDIKILDHIIITSESCFSFADEGLL